MARETETVIRLRPGREHATDPLAGTAGVLAGLASAARGGALGAATALASLTTARRLAAELDHAELALIEAARHGGATWAQIATAMGARNRQTAQKRHADLSRRHPRPPRVDTPETRPDAPAAESDVAGTKITPGTVTAPAGPGGDWRTHDAAARAVADTRDPGIEDDDLAPVPARLAGTGQHRQADPKITPAIISEGRYEIVKAPGHAESRAWHVLVGGKHAGTVRPTWRKERGRRPGWEAADNTGTVLPVTGISQVTAAGNARTRDAAAVSLLQALLRQQQNERRRGSHT